MNLTLLSKITADRERYIEDALGEMDSRMEELENALIMVIATDVGYELTADSEGGLDFSERNLNKVQNVDNAWSAFAGKYLAPFLLWMGTSIVGQVASSRKYFALIGGEMPGNLSVLNNVVGMNSAGTELVSGGYIDSLAFPSPVIQGIKDYVIRSLATNIPFTDFRDGLTQLIKGQENNPGILKQYYNTYAGDLWNQFQRITDNMFAKKMGLKHFLYAGTLIAKSRQFCIARAGKVFTVEETADWKCDPDLPGNKGGGCDETYQPLVELGRWNCRHSVAWVDEKTAEVLKSNEEET